MRPLNLTNMLYKKHNYLNKNIQYLVSNEIIEYDIQSAGFNLIKKFNLMGSDQIQYLEALPKKRRQIHIGLAMKKDKELVQKLNAKFVEAREWFFVQNELKEDDILSIKKDAIFTLRRCHELEWDNIQFAEKNIYTSYYYMNGFEFYYNRECLDVKGISDERLEHHKEYMLDFISTFCRSHEIGTRKGIIELLLEFSHHYRHRNLEMGYYRELNKDSLFRFHDKYQGSIIGFENVSSLDNIDIGYNYAKYFVPLINLLV